MQAPQQIFPKKEKDETKENHASIHMTIWCRGAKYGCTSSSHVIHLNTSKLIEIDCCLASQGMFMTATKTCHTNKFILRSVLCTNVLLGTITQYLLLSKLIMLSKGISKMPIHASFKTQHFFLTVIPFEVKMQLSTYLVISLEEDICFRKFSSGTRNFSATVLAKLSSSSLGTCHFMFKLSISPGAAQSWRN